MDGSWMTTFSSATRAFCIRFVPRPDSGYTVSFCRVAGEKRSIRNCDTPSGCAFNRAVNADKSLICFGDNDESAGGVKMSWKTNVKVAMAKGSMKPAMTPVKTPRKSRIR